VIAAYRSHTASHACRTTTQAVHEKIANLAPALAALVELSLFTANTADNNNKVAKRTISGHQSLPCGKKKKCQQHTPSSVSSVNRNHIPDNETFFFTTATNNNNNNNNNRNLLIIARRS
jgi:hypothetical protein